jgi:ABC-2 type transport system permease protein
MRRAVLVAEREVVENFRTKTFWIGVFSFPLILLLAGVVPALFQKAKDVRRFAVIDRSGWLAPAVEERIAVEDARQLLNRLAAVAALKDPAVLGEFPSFLRELTPLVKGADAKTRSEMALVLAASGRSRLAADSEKVTIPTDQREKLRAAGPKYLAWWRALDLRDAKSLKAGITREDYQPVEPPAGPDPEAEVRGQLEHGRPRLFAYFVIGRDPELGNDGNKYVCNNLTDQDLKNWYVGLASREIEARRFDREKIAPDVVARIQSPFQVEVRQLSETGAEKSVETKDVIRQWAPVAFVYLLWISIFSISQMLLTNTIEEKSSRIIEVLLSSVSPVELLAGKIAGMAATGLTMIGSWVLFIFCAVKILPYLFGSSGGVDLSALLRDPIYLASFVVYFLLGYLFYASLLVGLGSVCNSLKEAQNLMQPIIILLLLPLMAMVPVGQDPNGTLARILSFFPPFTPFVMMNRSAGPPALWEYLATTVLLIISVAGVLWTSAKVFRIGILMTGKPPRLVDIVRWLKAPVGHVPER